MIGPERRYRTPENDEELLAQFERINQEENPIERMWKLERFYEEIEVLNEQDDDAQDTNEQSPLFR